MTRHSETRNQAH